MPILSLPASLTLTKGELIMQDMYPDTESLNHMLHLALKVVQEAPECRESRIAEVQRALHDQHLMLEAEVLTSRIMADPLHQAHCDL